MAEKDPTTTATGRQRSNVRIAAACLGFFAGMVGLAYASVPLYDLFCRVTGYGGTTQVADTSPVEVLDRSINVRFDANSGAGLGWDFAPVDRQVTLKIGELTQVAYRAENWRDVPTTGSATFNVTPQAAGAYFNKMECFCFTETTLEPGQSTDMPVVFFIDPAIVDAPELEGVSTITLSYTFFKIDQPAETVRADRAALTIERSGPDATMGAAMPDRGRMTIGDNANG
ncbi:MULTISPECIES: cytochrome c oxidase assembly protein [unclassified Roseitalea]|uniref:cytochrome c oxidase assembly protein n=1 Tax=unclassified Roseitalea TaxID=2639107 RepID=UPI00273E79FE|nr:MULTISPECIES: cytochrome c oxidase assembly protein [unclassified Roseitalea]